MSAERVRRARSGVRWPHASPARTVEINPPCCTVFRIV
ncbi:hypothetical protein C7S16_5934 [Burkholderia thailandensis]|uniref:Uncharacterized protein n=1 Tax=Burkholderia thailandensis TaxID=57975 RepID=A0AAW9CZ97_BURTH|nr:hypothetical protein [Burkholderia thailandensis]MDW9253074.1 hypothetical protein [Burkholderia thailandensis]